MANALSCVIRHPQPSVTPGGKSEKGRQHGILLTGDANGGYARLSGKHGLEMLARLRYEIVPDDRDSYGPLRVTTKAYDYSIQTADKSKIIDFHWHPAGSSCVTFPHCHIGGAQLRDDAVLTRKMHVPTGRITLEYAIRFAVEIGCEPHNDRWEKVLEGTEAPHLQFRSWS